MSFDITQVFNAKYTDMVQLKLQQKTAKLRPNVMVKNFQGKSAQVVQQIASVDAILRTSRHGDTQYGSTPHDSRWIYPQVWDAPAELIDDPDKLQMLIDPASEYSTNHAAALARAQDDVLITASLGTAKTGIDGGTSTSFLAGNVIASSSVGLTIQKLRDFVRLALVNQVDVENDPLFLAISAKQHDDLLALTQVTSSDFNGGRPTLVDGYVKRFMGINFVLTERLPVNGSSERRCIGWSKSGLCLGIWGDVQTSIDRMPGKKNSTQVFSTMTIGATRVEEKKVFELACSEA